MLLEFFVKNVLQWPLGKKIALTLKEPRVTDCLIYIGIRYGLLFLEKKGDDASATRASEEYQKALNFLINDDYANAAKTAGIMSHWIVLEKELKGHIETEEVTDSDVVLEGVTLQ